MRCEFPFPSVHTQFGTIPEPRIDLPVKLAGGYLSVRFFLDTGADLSMLPLAMAEDAGVDLNSAATATVLGIEGKGIQVSVGDITVQIGDEDVSIPCLFTPNENIPALLGRAGIFDRFNVLFDIRRRRIVFDSMAP